MNKETAIKIFEQKQVARIGATSRKNGISPSWMSLVF